MIPLSTTTISVLRLPDDSADPIDPYDEQPRRDVIFAGVRAHISSPRGTEQVAGGSQEVVRFRLDCDPIDLRHTDQVRDDMTNALYDVVWARSRVGFGLEHVEADLKQVTGLT